MKLIRLRVNNDPKFGLKVNDSVLFIDKIPDFDSYSDLITMIESGVFDRLRLWTQNADLSDYEDNFELISKHTPIKLIDSPNKLIGIGLNYMEHANDLTTDLPTDFPTIFIKPSTVLVGQGMTISLPVESNRVTGEAELGIVFNHRKREGENWIDAVAGFVPIIDMTAEDILKQNTRYLGLSKIFDTFLSLGSELITPDEFDNIGEIRVSTILNGNEFASNVVSNMRFNLEYLVTFLSKIMSIKPGDIISTGTPRATPINHGDRIECRISNFQPLFNPVLDMKKLEV